jgi:hypothetical protein
MGRPIKKIFFANLNQPPVGGEGVASVSVGATGTNYSAGATLVFSAPNLVGGTTASGSASIAAGAGGITAVAVVTAGSGYTSTASITVTTATSVSVAGTGTTGETTIYATTSGIFTGMFILGTGVGASAKVSSIGAGTITASVANASTVTGTLSFFDGGSGAAFNTVLTNSRDNGIATTAYITDGSSALVGDIVKQEASRRYLVETADGIGQARLVAKANGNLAEGEMNILATDVNGSTYYVTKLTARRAVLSTATDNGGFEYADGAVSGWSLAAATTGTVSIASF